MKTITQENLISKFKKIDTSDVFQFKKISNQILWVLRIIKVDFNIDDHIPASVLTNLLIDGIGISTTTKKVINALSPIRNKINKKIIEDEISYKIMQEGITGVNKFLKSKKKSTPSIKQSEKAILEDTIREVRKLSEKKKITPGLYYIVFVDLNSSSLASAKIGPEENQKRIDHFIQLTKEALSRKPRGHSLFIKKIGDGALFLFTNFEDIKDWAKEVDNLCDKFNKKCITDNKAEIFQLYSTKCIHLGEVFFNNQLDPIAFAVNQLFKIEKEFQKVQLGITDIVKQVILPRITSGELEAEEIKKVVLVGESEARPIWNIAYRN